MGQPLMIMERDHDGILLTRPPQRQTATPKALPDEPWQQGYVRWFDYERAYGFVRSETGLDAVLPKRIVQQAGKTRNDILDEAQVRFKSRPVPGRSPEVIAIKFL